MKQKKVFAEVIGAEPLMVISSRYRPFTKIQKYSLLAIYYVVGVACVATGVLVFQSHGWVYSIAFAAISLLIPAVGHRVVQDGTEREIPMMVTEKGIALGPSRCLLWEQISGWEYCTDELNMKKHFTASMKGLYAIRVFTGFFGTGQGPFEGGRGRSLFAIRGYLLDQEQQANWERICTEKGISRR